MNADARLGHRFFIVDGEAVARLSQRSFNDFFFHERPALPDHAGATLAVAMVIYELKGRKPERVVRIDVNRFRVLQDGSMDKDHFGEGMRLSMDRGFGKGATAATSIPDSNVVDAKGLFDERRWRQHHPEISGPALKNILTSLFGDAR